MTAAERLKEPVYPVVFSSPKDTYTLDNLSITVHPEYEDRMITHLDSMRPIRPWFRRVVSDFEFAAGRIGKKVRLGPRHVTYVLLGDRRLIELRTHWDPNSEAERLEHTFDSMAKTFNLLTLSDSKGAPGTYRTYDGETFSFEYPADWIVQSAYDDEKNIGVGVSQFLSIRAPERPDRALWNEPARISCIQWTRRLDKKATLENIALEVKRGVALMEGETSFGSEAYETRLGQKGIKYWFTVKIPPTSGIKSVHFIVPASHGRLQCLSFRYSQDHRKELESIIEHVGRSFVVK
ncbi:MAG: hypothetical protein IID34_14800 [Planctomycetes bacterium]|nr:hypothetical protein [Planctomycetota bacterium]